MEKTSRTVNDEEEPVPLMYHYAVCSQCGRQLGKYEPPCSKHITVCPKCGAQLSISANAGALVISLMAAKQRRGA